MLSYYVVVETLRHRLMKETRDTISGNHKHSMFRVYGLARDASPTEEEWKNLLHSDVHVLEDFAGTSWAISLTRMERRFSLVDNQFVHDRVHVLRRARALRHRTINRERAPSVVAIAKHGRTNVSESSPAPARTVRFVDREMILCSQFNSCSLSPHDNAGIFTDWFQYISCALNPAYKRLLLHLSRQRV